MKYEEEESEFEVIHIKLQILNLNETDKNCVELVNNQSQIEIKSECVCINSLMETVSNEPYLHSSMNCVIEVKYTNKVAHSQFLCRTTRRNFCVKFMQILTLTSLQIFDLK